jgi:hypothetical protein
LRKLYYFAFIYLGLGLLFGVFYREFTVFHEFTGNTQLAVLHTHTLVLGMLFFLLLLVFERLFKLSEYKRFNLWLIIYNIGFGGLLLTMLIRGIGQVVDWELSGFNHISGLFHTILGLAFVWFFIVLGKRISS